MDSPNPEAITLATEQPPTYLLPKRSSGNLFRCSLCHKVFKRPEHLKRHEKVHVIGKAHACATCGKRFARRWAVVFWPKSDLEQLTRMQ